MSLRALPEAHGLYDPANEHDACGVGFVCNIKNVKSRRIVEQGLELLVRLTHRGAVGADPRAGDGAGILVQIPDAFFRAEVGFDLPPAGSYGVGMVFLPQDAACRQEMVETIERNLDRGRSAGAGLARCPGGQQRPGRERPAHGARHPAGLRRLRRQLPGPGRLRAQAVRGAQAHGQRHPRRGARQERLLRHLHVLAHHHLQGDAARGPGGHLFPRPPGPALRLGPGPGAPALLDQYLPDLGPGPPLPHDLPQRRDQYLARQRQLDGGAALQHALRAPGRRPGRHLAPDPRGPVRLGLLRQCPGAAGDGRLLAGPRHDAADPRGLGRQQADGRAAPRLLRVPRGPDGALGRPGRGGLHRRPPDRRHPGPQRPAPRPLSGHQRRPGGDGLRDGRARHPRGEDRQEVAPAARQDVPHRPGAGAHHRRRRDQGRSSPGPGPTANGSSAPRSTSTSCPRTWPPWPRTRTPCWRPSRPSATPRRTSSSCSPPWS